MINHKFTFIAVETGLAAKGYKTNNSDRYKAFANGWLPTNGRQQSSVGFSAIKVCKRTPALSHPHYPLTKKKLSNNNSPISFDCIVSRGCFVCYFIAGCSEPTDVRFVTVALGFKS